MTREISLIDYLPPATGETKEMQELMSALNPTAQELWSNAETILREAFVVSAENTGLERMELMLGLNPAGSIEDRRFRIITRLNNTLPYTYEKLCDIIESLCGKENVSIRYESEKFLLTVKIALTAKSHFESIKNLLWQIVPCNIQLSCILVMNTHSVVGRFTHSQLAAYIHRQLHEEVLRR